MNVEKLRKALAEHSLAAFMQPVNDEYMSEYPPACNRRVEWLSGFSGSAGTVVVATHKAALFTDGRYTLQAKNEVDGNLFEQHNSGVLTPEAWLMGALKAGDKVGYDPRLCTSAMVKRIESVLSKKNVILTPVENLIDPIWSDRPATPQTPLFIHELQYAGESWIHQIIRPGEDRG